MKYTMSSVSIAYCSSHTCPYMMMSGSGVHIMPGVVNPGMPTCHAVAHNANLKFASGPSLYLLLVSIERRVGR